MTNKPLTDKEKQFSVLPNEADPKNAFLKANVAAAKALAEIKKNTKAKR